MVFDKEKLINLRWGRRLKQCEVAAGIGVKPPVMNSWETGRHAPSAPMLMKLAQFFGVSPEYFFASDDS
jgi:transcriptional regulator with XRE-family HTH domain